MKKNLCFLTCYAFLFAALGLSGTAHAQIISTVVGTGGGGYSGDGIPATTATLGQPFQITVDAAGNIYIADYYNQRIRKVDLAGIITTVAGNGVSGFSGDGGPATAAQLAYPDGVALDATGNLYITDQANFRIRKVNTSGIITTFAGNGSYGHVGDGGPATAAGFNYPTAITVDGSGNIYIADDTYVRKINTSGIISTAAGIATYAYSGDGGPATAAGMSPIDVETDAAGNLYIADVNNNRIRMVNSSGIINTIAGDGTYAFGGDGGPATAASLKNPFGLAVDASGNLYISDRLNNRIRKITGGIINTVAGNGTGGYSGDGGPALAAQLHYPLGMGFDGSGALYFLDSSYRVRKLGSCVSTLGAPVGSSTVCVSSTITLTNATSGGTWSASNANATVGSTSGIVTGVTAGTVTISYSLSTGCYTTKLVTVNPMPASIAGPAGICLGSTGTLTDATPGGSWSSSNTAIATIGSGSGIVTAVAVGCVTITYATGSCYTTYPLCVNPLPTLYSVTGGGSYCAGSSGLHIGLTGSSTGINYELYIGGTPTGTIIAGTGSSIDFGLQTTAGTYTVVATNVTTGCTATMTGSASITVNPLPGITGPTALCPGGTGTLTSSSPGGVWTSGTPSVATVGSSSGVVTGVSTGTATITYTLISTGCASTVTVTVNASVGAISGSLSVCTGNTTTLASTTPGGTWTSNTPAVATVGSLSGVVTGVVAGTTIITYSLGTSCTAIATVTVVAGPASITGPSSACVGSTITLSSTTGGGAWSSSATSVATVSGGVVTGVSSGVVTITYTVGPCYVTKNISVNASPSVISGSSSVCVGITATFTNSVPGGTWSSSTPSVASVGSSSGIVTGIASGTATITYSIGGCIATKPVTVNASAPITGTATVCVGASTTLSDATPGGTWSSGTSSVATVVSGTGVVTGVAPGTSVITYFIPGGCSVTLTVTVVATPASILGTLSVCVGGFTYLSDATSGGTWSSGTTSVATVGSSSGIVSGVSLGTSVIDYSIGSCSTSVTVTVVTTPSAISGTTSTCVGMSSTLSDAVPGGTWSSSDVSVATVGSLSGVVTGISSGSIIITYTISSTSCRVIAPFVVNPLAPITGPSDVCIGQTITLTDTALGGSWSSGSPGIAVVGISTGIVTGVATGTAMISYTLPTGCVAVKTVSVLPLPSTIVPATTVCVGQSSTLYDATPGGVWSSANPAIGTISGSGVVTGISAGTVTISYTIGTGCAATAVVTVNPQPSAISGPHDVCLGSTITLTDATSGGLWTSSNPATASVGSSSGIVTGITLGAATITYMISTGCVATLTINVDSFPGPITGSAHVCVGTTSTLADPTPGGVWSSSNPAIAAIGSATGDVTGMAAGTATISYSIGSGCTVVTIATVTPIPMPISGSTTICAGTSATLSDGIAGGMWSSSDPSIAFMGSLSGIVTGVIPGTVVITYTLAGLCSVSTLLVVNPAPSPITGINSVCVGASTLLSDATPGGTWSSLAPGTASVSGGGLVTGFVPGTATIVYTLGTGCLTTRVVTVNTFPAPITGAGSVCVGSSITLSDISPGGTWSSSDITIATVSLTGGIVTGASGGIATITYSRGVSCEVTADVTVNPLPAAISGAGTVCQFQAITLTDATPGGTWSSSNPSIGSVNSLGDVTGIIPGTITISYTDGFGCSVTHPVTVFATPLPITGSLFACLGGTTTLHDAVSGGTWLSLNTAVATIGSSSGIVSGLSTGTATIAYTLPGGCFVSTTVTVNALPTAFTVTGGGSFCASSPGVHIGLSSSTVGVNYLLHLGSTALGSFPGTGGPLDFGLLTVAGTYTVTGTATGTTCTASMLGSAVVSILPPVVPTVAIVAAPNDTVCSGTVTSFSTTSTHGGSAPTFQWFVNGLPVTTTSTYSYIPLSGDVVHVRMTSNDPCPIPDTAANSITMTVIPSGMPVVTLFVNPNDTVCMGTTVFISPVPTYGGPSPSYAWYRNGVSAGGGFPFAFTPDDGDNIFCIMTSNDPCRLANKDTSAVVTITVDTPVAPTVSIAASPGTTILSGQYDTLTALVGGAVNPTYQWYVNGSLIPGATSSTYISNSFHYPTADSISCQVTSHDICTVVGYNWIFIHVVPNGIGNLNGGNDITILPNPNKGSFTIKGSLASLNDEEISLDITNILGQVVYRDVLTARNGKLNALVQTGGSLANGMYIISLRSGTDTRTFHIVIEQ